VKDGTAVAEDVALATAKFRLAMKGGLDVADGHFDGVTVAVLDKKGCAAYTQRIQGTFGHPEIGKITMLTSLAGPVLGVLETVQKLNPFQQCEVFYKGSVAQPE
jgi:AsmA protein